MESQPNTPIESSQNSNPSMYGSMSQESIATQDMGSANVSTVPKDSNFPEPGQIEGVKDPLPETTAWWFDKNTPGKGPIPDFLDHEKYGNMWEQAKAYPELLKMYNKKIGSVDKAPETYELTLNDNVANQVDINIESPEFNKFVEFAQKSNMSNDMFNQLVNLHLESQVAMHTFSDEEASEFRANEIKKLGDHGAEMVEQVVNWGKNNFSDDEFNVLESLCHDADSLKIFHKIANLKSTSSLPGSSKNIGYTDEELRLMLDDPRYKQHLDPGFRQRVDELYRKRYG